jgi:ketosteroid isomerase-like protein
MNARQTVETYVDRLARKSDWESLLADDIAFTTHTSPNKRIAGKDAYLQATKRFYSMIVNVEVRSVIADGDSVCALTRYQLQPPNGSPTFESDVAEVFTVKSGKIGSLDIYFDSAPFPK